MKIDILEAGSPSGERPKINWKLVSPGFPSDFGEEEAELYSLSRESDAQAIFLLPVSYLPFPGWSGTKNELNEAEGGGREEEGRKRKAKNRVLAFLVYPSKPKERAREDMANPSRLQTCAGILARTTVSLYQIRKIVLFRLNSHTTYNNIFLNETFPTTPMSERPFCPLGEKGEKSLFFVPLGDFSASLGLGRRKNKKRRRRRRKG